MTKKHYIKLVELIKSNINYDLDNERTSIDCDNFIADLTTYLKEDNPNFNTATFIEALEK